MMMRRESLRQNINDHLGSEAIKTIYIR
jgi:hypothetical protein